MLGRGFPEWPARQVVSEVCRRRVAVCHCVTLERPCRQGHLLSSAELGVLVCESHRTGGGQRAPQEEDCSVTTGSAGLAFHLSLVFQCVYRTPGPQPLDFSALVPLCNHGPLTVWNWRTSSPFWISDVLYALFLGGGLQPAVLRGFFCLCTQESFLVVDHMVCHASDPGWPHTRQEPFLLHYRSDPLTFLANEISIMLLCSP